MINSLPQFITVIAIRKNPKNHPEYYDCLTLILIMIEKIKPCLIISFLKKLIFEVNQSILF